MELHKTAEKSLNSSMCFAVEQDRIFVRGALSDLVRHSAMSSGSRTPEVSLREGRWVKLICGASFEVSGCVVSFSNEIQSCQ